MNRKSLKPKSELSFRKSKPYVGKRWEEGAVLNKRRLEGIYAFI